MAAQPNTAYTS